MFYIAVIFIISVLFSVILVLQRKIQQTQFQIFI